MATVSFTREEIDRTITELLRKRTVAGGYLPDVLSFPSNMPAYEAARAAIITGGNQLIDVFGVGSNYNRGEKNYNRIFVNLRQYNNGTVSHAGESDYVQTQSGPTLYQRELVYASTKNIIYDIRTVCSGKEATKYDRICTDIVFGALTTSSSCVGIPVLKPDFTFDYNRMFFIRYLGTNAVNIADFLERQIAFEVVDVWLDGDIGPWGVTVPTTNIPPINRIIGSGGAEEVPPPSEIIVDSQ